MAVNRYIGKYPVIGIRPIIDARLGPLQVRQSLEKQTMGMQQQSLSVLICSTQTVSR